jgi:hypothetical protein
MLTWFAEIRRRHPVLVLIGLVLLGALASTGLSELWGQGVPYGTLAVLVLVLGPIQLVVLRRRVNAEVVGEQARPVRNHPGAGC